MSYEPSDGSMGRSGYPPPFGASYEWNSAYREYQQSMSPPSTSWPSARPVSTSFSPGVPSETPYGLAIVVSVEAFLLGVFILLFCSDLVDLGVFSYVPLSVLPGVAAAIAYFCLSTWRATIYWMLLPRMIAWSWLGLCVTSHYSSGSMWHVFFAGLAAGITSWSAVSAKEELEKNK